MCKACIEADLILQSNKHVSLNCQHLKDDASWRDRSRNLTPGRKHRAELIKYINHACKIKRLRGYGLFEVEMPIDF
jgi:hypothetical protein